VINGSLNFKLEIETEMVMSRDPEKMNADALMEMIENNGSADAASMMVDVRRIYPALIDLFTHKKQSVRLEAIKVFDGIVEKDILLAYQVVAPLWDRFHRVNDAVMGDILCVFGRSKYPGAISKLRAVALGDYSPGVRKAAEEALERLSEK